MQQTATDNKGIGASLKRLALQMMQCVVAAVALRVLFL